MTEGQKRKLEQRLWEIANALRGKMDADHFRDYILGFIFYKYLSEKIIIYANKILEHDKKKYTELNQAEHKDIVEAVEAEAIKDIGYFLKPKDLFHELVKRGNANNETKSKFILDDLSKILNNIQQSTMGTESEEDFINLFEDLDLDSSKLGKSPETRNEVIIKIISERDKIDFGLDDINADILGDAYEYLIANFASGAGKKAGEFYTPQKVSTILAKLVTHNKHKLKSVYDPTCGSGSLLLRVAKEVKEVAQFYGQEQNRTTYNLCRMNMILHDVNYRNFDIKQDDTLKNPQHQDKRFEAIVANPPFSVKWEANPALANTDDRFSQYGKLAPSSKADFAFVQHMIYHLADNGQMAVVLPHGVLFRGASEGHIRKFIIKEKNFLDAVIGLPANIFYGTSIPTCILVFKKCREYDDILFIDASQNFEKAKNQNNLRDEDVEKIVHTYKNRIEENKYSYKASLKEIADNDYNLNIPRYVDTFEEEEQIEIGPIVKELKQLETQIKDTEKEIAKFCKELNIPTPF